MKQRGMRECLGISNGFELFGVHVREALLTLREHTVLLLIHRLLLSIRLLQEIRN